MYSIDLYVAPCNSNIVARITRQLAPRLAVSFTALALGCSAEGSRERDTSSGAPGAALATPTAVDDAPAATTAALGSPFAGDDQPQRIVEIGELTSSPPPAECIARLPPRLPDCSPDDYTTPRGLDCDGDGVLDHRIMRCEVATAERPSTFAGDFDCDPSDPGLRHWVWRDADGDGAGDGYPRCAGPRVPEGYVRIPEEGWGNDCDDGDAAVSPGALDVWGDGVDSDCYNGDLPACGVLEKGSTPARVLETEGCSTGPDLYLSSVAACGWPCLEHGSLFGFVGNSGGEPAAGPIVLHYRDDRGGSGQLELSPDGLAPGAATPLFEVPFSLIGQIDIWLELTDCDPDNQRFGLDLPRDPDSVCPI